MTLLFSERGDFQGINPVCDFFTEIIDADDVAGQESAALLPKEKATVRGSPFVGESSAQEPIDKQKDAAVSVFNPSAAAGS